MGKIIYTEEQNLWFINNSKNHTIDEIKNMFNCTFNENKSYDAIKSKLKNMKLNFKRLDNTLNWKKKRNLYTQEETEWIVNNRKKYKKIEELRVAFNEKFSREITYKSIKTFLARRKIYDGKRRLPHKFSEEELQWVKDNYQNYFLEKVFNHKKFCDDFNKKFNHILRNNDVRNLIVLKLGIQLPYSQKDYIYNYNEVRAPIGHEVLTKNGWFVKISNKKVVKNKNSLLINYRRKSNIMYEKYYNCKIDDKKQYVMFIDNDFNNLKKENLMLVNWEAQKRYNSKYKSKNNEFENKKIKRTAIMLCQLETIAKTQQEIEKEVEE